MLSEDEEQRSEQVIIEAIKKYDSRNEISGNLIALMGKIGKYCYQSGCEDTGERIARGSM
jgi:hypothetical protein